MPLLETVNKSTPWLRYCNFLRIYQPLWQTVFWPLAKQSSFWWSTYCFCWFSDFSERCIEKKKNYLILSIWTVILTSFTKRKENSLFFSSPISMLMNFSVFLIRSDVIKFCTAKQLYCINGTYWPIVWRYSIYKLAYRMSKHRALCITLMYYTAWVWYFHKFIKRAGITNSRQ